MSWFETFDTVAAAALPGLKVLCQEPMAGHTTFKVGGPARRMAVPSSTEEMAALLTLAEKEGWPLLLLGNGSNLLVSDEGVDALVIHTGGLDAMTLLEGGRIRAEAGLSLNKLAVFAQKNGLAGLEFAHGIPGSLGGGIRMNAGAYGGEMCQVVESVAAWIPGAGVVEIPVEEMAFSYRHSRFTGERGVVLAATFRLTGDAPEAIRARMDDLIGRRKEKQPLEYPSAGSTFKRPAGHFAGALIEQCGLKGYTVGGAQVSEKHAGFVINIGGATASDILALMDHVRSTVLAQTGVELEPEVEIVS